MIPRGGSAENLAFDKVVVPSKYGCEVIEWISGFEKKYFKIYFGH